jgi:medium-chain acyl-[acyl-carrier-protein] hydrolase
VDEDPLECPIEAFGGLEDDEVRYEEISAWRKQTLSSFTQRMFPGDHFFVNSSRTLIMEAIAQGLKPTPLQRTKGTAHVSG